MTTMINQGDRNKKDEDKKLKSIKRINSLEGQAEILQAIAILSGLVAIVWAVIIQEWYPIFIGAGVMFIGLIYSNIIYVFCGMAKELSVIRQLLNKE